MTSSNHDGNWMDGRKCPDCENADGKLVDLQMVKTEVDNVDIVWEKWECPACLYFVWEEIGEAGAT